MILSTIIMLVACSSASFLFFSLILISSLGWTMFAINVTTGYRYDGSCLMAVMTSGSAAGPPSEFGCLDVATTSLRLRWRPSSALVVACEAAMKPEGSAA